MILRFLAILVGVHAIAFDNTLAEHGDTVIWRSHIYGRGEWSTYGLSSVSTIYAYDSSGCVDAFATGSEERHCTGTITNPDALWVEIFDPDHHGSPQGKARGGRVLAAAPRSSSDLCRVPGEEPERGGGSGGGSGEGGSGGGSGEGGSGGGSGEGGSDPDPEPDPETEPDPELEPDPPEEDYNSRTWLWETL